MPLMTECPNCGRRMTADEYMNLDRCPSCGRGFAGFGYTAAIFLGIFFTVVAWLIHWKKSTRVSLVGAAVMTCFSLGFAALCVTIDRVLQCTTHLSKRARRRLTGWLTVSILLVIAFLTKDYVIALTKE